MHEFSPANPKYAPRSLKGLLCLRLSPERHGKEEPAPIILRKRAGKWLPKFKKVYFIVYIPILVDKMHRGGGGGGMALLHFP